jgi:hypothetical protein
MKKGKFTTSTGANFEIVEIVKNTSLNNFTGAPIMYGVKWIDNTTRVFTPAGIQNIIKYQ